MFSVNEYLYNTEIRLTGAFTVAGTATDPTTVSLKIKKPDGTVLTFTYAGTDITKDSTGNYHYDYTPPVVGRYSWRWEGSGTVKAADEGAFIVNSSSVI